MVLQILRKNKLALGIILVPFLISVLYYVFFAMDRYVSSAQISVRETSQTNSGSELPGLAIMLGAVNPTSREETLYLRQYILSPDMMDALEKKLHWRERYLGHWRDPFYWLRASESKEQQFDFYQRVVTATFDEETGLLTVQVEAFDPAFAQQALQVILADSERFVNEISHRMARDQMSFAETEMAKNRRRYEDRREEVLRFQATNNLLDPETTATAHEQIIIGLEQSLTKDNARLSVLNATLNSDSPQITELKNHIRATEDQLKIENRRLVSSPSGDKLNVVVAHYRNLTIEAKIAEDAYKTSITAVETARIEATKKLRSLVTVVLPNRPDEAIYPERIYNLITILIVLVLLYGIARFIIAAIEDHRD
ncbi:capsular polysaccharide transport system permease protein [Paraburkholderia caballeronis]|uniref:Wzz/FepE/Etk N-terminal domain-containing protein n=1 Tax=Paraburkholderia caballeronis TaxID=416943 RepID=UPI001066F635|nr:Wzz/FepE/Etk N-terminal domain-containing protein [Paraburkholderia caballeronis]TDV37324.1 capsular polysaccharide transport system permease protein [Paraburkholderia caballeronis]